jgi:hypothetical protein
MTGLTEVDVKEIPFMAERALQTPVHQEGVWHDRFSSSVGKTTTGCRLFVHSKYFTRIFTNNSLYDFKYFSALANNSRKPLTGQPDELSQSPREYAVRRRGIEESG